MRSVTTAPADLQTARGQRLSSGTIVLSRATNSVPMSLAAILTLGFFLGMRHATDADHVVAVSTIVSRERSLRAAAPIGVLWGLGHTLTIVVVGGTIVAFGIVLPPRITGAMELPVAAMLLVLGVLAIRGRASHKPGASVRPLVVGVVHGLAGSAALALLVVGAIHDPLWGMLYLALFGGGTIAGMLLVTTALAVPMLVLAKRFEHFQRGLAVATGIASVAFGCFVAYGATR